MNIKPTDEEIPIDPRIVLPPHFKHLRKAQLDAAEATVSMFNDGIDVVVLEASVGFGKSIYAEIVRQLMKKRMLYVAPKNELIDQMLNSLPYAQILKGRSRYPHGGPTGKIDFRKGITCAECTKSSLCREKSNCLYHKDKKKFNTSEVSITNTAYWLVAANYLGMFNPLSSAPPKNWIGGDYLTVFDEADTLEDSMLSFFEVTVSMDYLKEIAQKAMLNTTVDGIVKPYQIPIPPVRNFDKWMEWWIDLREMIEKALKKHGEPDPEDISMVIWVNRLVKLKLALDMVECDWIYDPVRTKNSKGIENGPAEKVTLKPLMIGDTGKKIMWDFCGKTICMSGSIISIDVFAEETGLDRSGKTYQLIRYETPWDVWRRTIFRVPGVEVTKKSKKLPWSAQPFWDEYVSKIVWILDRHPNDRYLIHAVSHDLAKELGKALGEIFGDRIIVGQTFTKKQKSQGMTDGIMSVYEKEETLDRDEALLKYLAHPKKVLVSASFSRGTDLPGDKCRGIIIAKVPWKSLGDRRIASRLEKTESGRLWYMVQAVRDILQSLGRGVRSSDDWCRLWVVDDQFNRIVQMRGLLPDYLKKTIREPEDYMDRGCEEAEKILKQKKEP